MVAAVEPIRCTRPHHRKSACRFRWLEPEEHEVETRMVRPMRGGPVVFALVKGKKAL